MCIHHYYFANNLWIFYQTNMEFIVIISMTFRCKEYCNYQYVELNIPNLFPKVAIKWSFMAKCFKVAILSLGKIHNYTWARLAIFTFIYWANKDYHTHVCIFFNNQLNRKILMGQHDFKICTFSISQHVFNSLIVY